MTFSKTKLLQKRIRDFRTFGGKKNSLRGDPRANLKTLGHGADLQSEPALGSDLFLVFHRHFPCFFAGSKWSVDTMGKEDYRRISDANETQATTAGQEGPAADNTAAKLKKNQMLMGALLGVMVVLG